jgi:hypothetical protein
VNDIRQPLLLDDLDGAMIGHQGVFASLVTASILDVGAT